MIRRLFVEKRPGFDVEAHHLLEDLRSNLGLDGLAQVRIINRYDVDGLDDEAFDKAKKSVFSEPNVDDVTEGNLSLDGWHVFAAEYLPGQYDQRADSAEQCIQLLVPGARPRVHTAKLIAISGKLSDEEIEGIKTYYINPIESRVASMEMPDTLDMQVALPQDVAVLDGFTDMDEQQMQRFIADYGLAMDIANLDFCRRYFADEGRNPTITELRILDTYWSDHCRHTTFMTEITQLNIEQGEYSPSIQAAYEKYLEAREQLYTGRDKPVTLMDVATIGAKLIKRRGKLADLDESEEINACSIKIKVDTTEGEQDWLLQFKNETHNHPTEIEPFGGAATCLGGAIRDILSGRAYAHHSMRITGSGDPNTPYSETLKGKLSQRKITTGAAAGFSSYGNQIGLSTGFVQEIYDEGYIAKRMELGAVVGACPADNVRRSEPQAGDIVILLGGRTGRDGIGGATGSSKEHDENSLGECGSEVQKGNAITERKIQRLFRDPELARMIKRCNDFGAGGVSVAIGELARGLDIDLDKVPRKYEGLDGTELAISESQERMAVVVDEGDVERFMQLAEGENLEAPVVAMVTDTERLRLYWRGKAIADISREFLDTNGVTGEVTASIKAVEGKCYLDKVPTRLKGKGTAEAWSENLKRLNVCAQTGLVQRFDSNIGAGSVLMPFGGKRQLTPEEGMVAKIPVLQGDTSTVSAMAYGYLPRLASWSPFHAGMYAVVESLSKMAAMGMDALSSRISMQEYFERMGSPAKWGKPAAALLGALEAQCALDVPAIGGKDSMSGTFEDLHVPPTIISFAVGSGSVGNAISAAVTEAGQMVYVCRVPHDQATRVPDWAAYAGMLKDIYGMAEQGAIAAASVIREGGLAAALTRMCVGNDMGVDITAELTDKQLFAADCGSIVLCLQGRPPVCIDKYQCIGSTTDDGIISVNGERLDIHELRADWMSTLEDVFPTKTDTRPAGLKEYPRYDKRGVVHASQSFARPRVVIPVFPGTNSEYDSARAFERFGAVAETVVINNLSMRGIEDSIDRFAKAVDNSQIIMLPGGFSSGDEPDGSGKFIATFLRNPHVAEAVNGLYKKRDGLILGICNGFQALVKTGLLPYGELGEVAEDAPTLTFNSLGRHVACMSYTRVQSVLSPWMMLSQPGDVRAVPMSHGEGRFTANDAHLKQLFENGQVATQYVDLQGNAALELPWNPNGSDCAIEGICSPDGRILGKMGHNERAGENVPKNIPGDTDMKLFESGVKYFK